MSKNENVKHFKLNTETSHQLHAKYLNNMEKTSLTKTRSKINLAKSRTIKRIFSHNLQLQHEMSDIKRGNHEKDAIRYHSNLNDPLTIINLFDKEKTLIGHYESCLTKKINQDNAAKKITPFSILNDEENEINLEAATITSIERIKNQTKLENKRISQPVNGLPIVSKSLSSIKSKSSTTSSDEKDDLNIDLVEGSDFEYLARRLSLFNHPQYMLSITKGAIKKRNSIQEAPKMFKIAKERLLIHRMATKDYF